MASSKKVRQNSQLPLQASQYPQKELQHRPYSQNTAIQEPALINATNNHNKSFKSILAYKNKHSQSACNSQKTLRKRLPNTLQSPSSNFHELNRIINENLSDSKKVKPNEVSSSQANKEQKDSRRTTRSQDRNVLQTLHQNIPPNQNQELLFQASVTPRLLQKQKELRQPIEKHIKYNKENRGIDFKPFQQQMFSPSTKLESKGHIVKQTPTPQVQKEVDETIESMQMEVDENVGHQRLPYAGIQVQNQITRPLQDKRQSNEHTSSRGMTKAVEDFPRLKLNFQNSQSFSSRTTFSSSTNDIPNNGLSSRLREQQASQKQIIKREHTLLFSQMPYQNTKPISRNRRRDEGLENRSSSKSVCNAVKFSKKKVSIASIDLQNSKNISQMQRSNSSMSTELHKKFVFNKRQQLQDSLQGSSETLQPHITDSTKKKSCIEASSRKSKSFLKPPTIIHRRKKISKQENCSEVDDTRANACIEVKMEDITPSNNSAFSFTPQFYKPPNNTVKRLQVKRVTGTHLTESAVAGEPSNKSKSSK